MAVRKTKEERVTELMAELGYADILDALQHAKEMLTALRIIHTWSGVLGALDVRHVRELTAKALHQKLK